MVVVVGKAKNRAEDAHTSLFLAMVSPLAGAWVAQRVGAGPAWVFTAQPVASVLVCSTLPGLPVSSPGAQALWPDS